MQSEPSFSQRLGARLAQLMRKDTEFLVVLSGLAMCWWAFTLALPATTFGTSPGYLGMALIGDLVITSLHINGWVSPETPWAILMAWTGLTMLGTLVLDHQRVLRWSAFWAAGLWGFVAATIGWSNPQGTGVGMYALLALGTIYAWWRLGMLSRGQL